MLPFPHVLHRLSADAELDLLDPVYPSVFSLPRSSRRSALSRSRYGRLALMKDAVKPSTPAMLGGASDAAPAMRQERKVVARALLPEFEDTTEGESSSEDGGQLSDHRKDSDSDNSDRALNPKEEKPRASEQRSTTAASTSAPSAAVASARIEPPAASPPSSLSRVTVDTEDDEQYSLPPAPPSSPHVDVAPAGQTGGGRSVPHFSLAPAAAAPAVSGPRVSVTAATRLNSPTVPTRVASAPVPPSTAAAAHTGDKSPTTPSTTVIVRGCYLLTQVDGVSTPPGKAFLSLNLTKGAGEGRGLQVVEDERVVRQIDIDHIDRCQPSLSDAHLLTVGYGGTKAAAFRLASHTDVQHVVALINGLTPSTSLTSPLPSSSSFSFPPAPSTPVRTQECIHKGWIEQWTPPTATGDGLWVRRYARLFTHRLLFYRSSTSPLPVHVFPLSARDERGVVIGTTEERHLIIEFPSDKTGVSDVVWRCADAAGFTGWTHALRINVGSEPMSPTSPSSPAVASPSTLSTPPATIALAPTLSSQKAFMSYVFELAIVKPLFPSSLATSTAFQQGTPSSFLRKRSASLAVVDSSLASYHLLMSSLSALWCEARLVMVDEYEQSGSGQIGFSFPGFDSQIFDVGRLSVIACAQLLSAETHALRFDHKDYHLAIESSSPAKEMMQSSPDFSSLYSAGQRERVKALAAQSQRLLLHHCSLASHMKAHQHELQNGDVIAWAEVLTSVDVRKNAELQDVFAPVAYVYNPTAGALHELIVALKKDRDSSAPYASFPELTAQSSPTAASTPEKLSAGGAVASPGSGNAEKSAKKGSFFGGKAKGKGPPSPTVLLPASPASPGTPLSPVRSASELRCLCDSVHLILLLRTLLHYRRHALSTLLTTINKTLPALSSSSDRVALQALTALQGAVDVERHRVVFVLSVLPKAEEIDKEVRRQRRERRERRAEQEVRRQAMKEREHELSIRQLIDGAKQAIDSYEAAEAEANDDGEREEEEEEEEGDEEEDEEDTDEVQVQGDDANSQGDSVDSSADSGSKVERLSSNGSDDASDDAVLQVTQEVVEAEAEAETEVEAEPVGMGMVEGCNDCILRVS